MVEKALGDIVSWIMPRSIECSYAVAFVLDRSYFKSTSNAARRNLAASATVNFARMYFESFAWIGLRVQQLYNNNFIS